MKGFHRTRKNRNTPDALDGERQRRGAVELKSGGFRLAAGVNSNPDWRELP
jgi:hypothetical protein